MDRIYNKLVWIGLIRPHLQAGDCCTVMYHGIDKCGDRTHNNRFFGVKSFEQQILYFRRHCNLVSLDQVFARKGLSQERMNLAITFDDGYRNNLTYAVPILEKLGVPATIFVTGANLLGKRILWADLLDLCAPSINGPILFEGLRFEKDVSGKFTTLANWIKAQHFIGTPRYDRLEELLLSLSTFSLESAEYADYWELMSDNEIAQLARSKVVKIGSHAMTHNNLGNMPESDAVKELSESKQYLENLAGYNIESVAYPDGSYSPGIVRQALEVGFKYQCAVDYRFEEGPRHSCLISRLGLYPPVTPHFVRFQISRFQSGSS